MAIAQAQSVKEVTQISEQESLQLTRNLLRIAIFNISYIRGLFPEKYFDDKYVPALEMKIKKLMPRDAESRRLVDWMEKGVSDALEKKYLKTLTFALCEALHGTLLEEYTFTFSYASDAEVSMDIARSGDSKKSKTFKASATDVTPTQMKSSACKMVRTLVQLMRTLDGVPDERTIVMKLLYYDEATPSDYEPPFFRACNSEDHMTWARNPLKMKVGDVNSRHYTLALKVRSVLDPCDGDEEAEDEGTHGSETAGDLDSASESEAEQESRKLTQDEVSNKAIQTTSTGADVAMKDEVDEVQPMQGSDAETEDESFEKSKLTELKAWVTSRHSNNIDVADAMASFPDMSVVLIEDLMERLVKENTLKRLGQDLYCLARKEEKQEPLKLIDSPQGSSPFDTSQKDYKNEVSSNYEEKVYTKALYHVLQLEHVTMSSLQKKLGREVDSTTVKALIDKMVTDGYLESVPSNKRLGRRVLRTPQAETKLKEIVAAVKSCAIQTLETMTTDNTAKLEAVQKNVPFEGNGSTIAQQVSLGSDVTVHQPGAEITENAREKRFKEPNRLQKQMIGSGKEDSSGSVRKDATPAGSCTSPNRNMMSDALLATGARRYHDSQESLESNRVRKASTVIDPIHQAAKRFRSET